MVRLRFRHWAVAAMTAATAVASAAPGSATYSYDDLGRLKSVLYEDGSAQTYTYDPAGNRQTTTSSTPAIFSITPSVSVSEGGLAVLTVTRSGGADAATLSYASANVTAIAGDNYTASSGSLSFAIGQNSQNISVPTLNNNRYDGSRFFSVTLTPTSGNAVSIANTASVTVNEVNAAPQFAIAPGPAVNEGNQATFTVSRVGATSLSHSISYSTLDGSAHSSSDYTATTSSLTFSPSDSPKSIAVQTRQVTAYEGTRSFAVVLSNPTGGAGIGTASANGTINDIDVPTTFSIAPAFATQIEGNPFTFNVTKGGGPAGIAFSLNYASASGSAISGTDFQPANGSLTFSTSDMVKTISVTTIDNRADTVIRNFTVGISNTSNGAPITTASATGSIQGTTGLSAPQLSPQNQLLFVRTTSPFTASYTLSWTAATGGTVDRYELYKASDGSGVFSLTYSGSLRTYSSTSTVAEYEFRARACNGATCGPYSNTVTVSICASGGCE